MDNTGDLRLLLASHHPLVIAEMREERRFLDLLRRQSAALDLPIWTWSVTRGLTRDGGAAQPQTHNPGRALGVIAQMPHPAIFVFFDVHTALEDQVFVRKVKEFAQGVRPRQTLVLTVPDHVAPPELDGLSVAWTLKPPSQDEVEDLVRRTLGDLHARNITVSLDRPAYDALVESLRGLGLGEAEQLIQRAALRDGKVDSDDLAYVRGAKAELLAATGVLELVEADHGTLDAVGGMANLKEWLALRGRAMEPKAKDFGLEPPKGVLITGIPGCGKSLVAKTLARTWAMPLVLLDPGRLYSSYVGESEGRLRDALRTLEAMAPVVVWVDEMEKAFDAGRANDGGVSKRILGTFLRWMQERPEGIFVIATSNDVTAMPPELLRKGRFDEIFFVDLPDQAERAEIFRLHLARRKRDPGTYDLERLSLAAEGFSGADIEAAVVGALYRAYAADEDLTTDLVVAEVGETVPLSKQRAEEIASLRDWASTRAVAA